jgi:hypothetical protein
MADTKDDAKSSNIGDLKLQGNPGPFGYVAKAADPRIGQIAAKFVFRAAPTARWWVILADVTRITG